MSKKYNNSKSALILQKYTPEDIQKLLNSGKFKSEIARQLKIHIRAFNIYIKEHNLSYKPPPYKPSKTPGSQLKNKTGDKFSIIFAYLFNYANSCCGNCNIWKDIKL